MQQTQTGSGVSPCPASAPVSHLKLRQPPSTTESQTHSSDFFKVKYVWKLAVKADEKSAMQIVGQPVATLRCRLEMKCSELWGNVARGEEWQFEPLGRCGFDA